MKKAIAPLVLSGVLLTACSGGSVNNPTPDEIFPLPAPGAANTGVPGITIPTDSPSPSASGAVSPAPAAILVLQPDGLSAVGTSAMLTFGEADQQTVRTALTNSLTGDVTSEQVQCAQGERARITVDGFQTLFDSSGTFVGWTETGSAEREITTANGIGLRSTQDDIQRAYSTVTIDGDTFRVSDGGLSGTLDNLNQVQTLSAGETCATQ